jgi:hypothetical protein
VNPQNPTLNNFDLDRAQLKYNSGRKFKPLDGNSNQWAEIQTITCCSSPNLVEKPRRSVEPVVEQQSPKPSAAEAELELGLSEP